jgi:hypothetical protein
VHLAVLDRSITDIAFQRWSSVVPFAGISGFM